MFDIDFQLLFNEYHEGNTRTQIDSLDKIHHFIYCYPKSRFKAEQDLCSAFYEWFLPKIETIFHDYDPSFGLNFETFVRSKVIYGFKSFCGRRKNNRNETGQHEQYNYIDEADNKPFTFHEIMNPSSVRWILENSLAKLKPRDEIILRLHVGLKLRLSNYRYIFVQLKKSNFKEKYSLFLSVRDERIRNVNKDRAKTLENLQLLNLRGDDLKKKPLLLRRKEILIEKLSRLNKSSRLREIADLFDISISTVHRRILKSSQYLAQELEKSGHNFDTLYAKMINHTGSA